MVTEVQVVDPGSELQRQVVTDLERLTVKILDVELRGGADDTINYSSTSLRDAVRELTEDQGVDVVYDPVGGKLAEQAMRALDWHGRFLVIGFASGEIPRLPLNLALLKEASIVGVWYGAWAERHPDELATNTQELGTMIEAGKITPRYSVALPFDRFADAFRLLAERRALGKVILRMEHSD